MATEEGGLHSDAQVPSELQDCRCLLCPAAVFHGFLGLPASCYIRTYTFKSTEKLLCSASNNKLVGLQLKNNYLIVGLYEKASE
jgi:hypothetical protein